MRRAAVWALVVAGGIGGGGAPGAQAAGTDAAVPAASSVYATPDGIDRSGFDAGVRPQDDFFRHVNGKWLERATIPADRGWWGVLPELRAESEARQRGIIEEMARRQDLPADSVARKIGAFYGSLTDQSLVEGKGTQPIAATLAAIDAIDSPAALARFFGAGNANGVDAPLGVGVISDPGAADRYIAYVWQSGLGLPDREYYLGDDPKFAAIRAAYPDYIAALLKLGGYGGSVEQGRAVAAIERRLASAHWPAERNREIAKLYNLVPVTELGARYPGFDWQAYLEASALGGRKDLMVAQTSYFEGLGALVAGTGLDAWRDYLRFHAINNAAPWLSGEFERAHFEFMQRRVMGLEQKAEDWKRAVRAIDAQAGEAIGQVYVERYFPAAYKARMLELVGNLLAAFRTSIAELEWMSAATRERAEAKRARMRVKIGYPDRWRDYGGLEIRADDPLGNLARAGAFEYAFQIAKLDKPIDREEWEMTPQTVNAYHEPFKNEIVFPAAFLAPPHFNMQADDAVNYGAIGYVIGHEIGHAFDDKGRAFDPHGKLNDWWTAEDAAHYEAAAARLADQFAAFSPLPGMHINGKLTLGENIADLTGLTIAWRAWRASLGGREAPVIDGLSGEQRFFIGFAQANRSLAREEILRSWLVSDPHSPGEYRVLGVLQNFEPFYAAYGLKPGDRMYLPPAQRVRIW